MMNTWAATTAVFFGSAIALAVNSYVDRTWYNDVVTDVVVDSVRLEGPNPSVDGHFVRTDRQCALQGVVGLVGSPAGWDRVKVEIRGAPDAEIGARPPGNHKFKRMVFVGARNVSGEDLLKATVVHHCDASGTGRKAINPITGKEEYVEFVRVETPFFTIPFPRRGGDD